MPVALGVLPQRLARKRKPPQQPDDENDQTGRNTRSETFRGVSVNESGANPKEDAAGCEGGRVSRSTSYSFDTRDVTETISIVRDVSEMTLFL